MNDSGLPAGALEELRSLSLGELLRYYEITENEARAQGRLVSVVRSMCLADLFYLIVRACGRKDMCHPWVLARTREVEAAPDGYLDLWFRAGYKSSIKTFGLTIQDILKNPDITFGFFSHTRPIAKAFLRQIMRELESNKILHGAFPDVLWGEDIRQAPKWSEDDGIVVKRKLNQNEATIEAWGLVDGMPTSKHFQVLNYDDVVTDKSVTTPEMIQKTTSALSLSYNLGARDVRMRFSGTYYHFGDTYHEIIQRGTAIPRIYPATDDGTENGEPVLLSQEELHAKRRDQGEYVYACQMLLNPKADALQGFKREWLRHYRSINPQQAARFNKYIVVDSANAKRKESDYTAMFVVGLGFDGNYYVLDMVRDRLNLTERVDRLFALYERWKPIKQVRWERYGLMADIQALKTEQEARNYRFDITEVGGITKKDDRIKRLLPIFEQGKMYLPATLHVADWQKNTVDLVHSFIEQEYYPFPMCAHKDMLDALSRIAEPDLKLTWPKQEKVSAPAVKRTFSQPETSWMA